MRWEEGTKHNPTNDNRAVNSINTSYSIFKSGSDIYGEANYPGLSDIPANTDAYTVIQAVLTAIAAGGSVFIKKDDYSLTQSLNLIPTGRVKVLSDGAKFTPPAADYALVIDANYADGDPLGTNCIVDGLAFDHTGVETGHGIKIQDIYHCRLRNLFFNKLSTGILVTDSATWTEHTVMKNLEFEDVDIGIKFDSGGVGTGSFIHSCVEHAAFNLRDDGAIGLQITNDANMAHSIFSDLDFWSYEDNQVQLDIDGNVDKALFQDIHCQCFKAGAASLIGIKFGTNMANIPIFIPEPTFDGTQAFSTNFSNAFKKRFVVHGSVNEQYIEHHTAADTLTTLESGSTHTNLGAGANIKLTLPQDAFAGVTFDFAVMTAAQQLQVDAGAAGAIYINGAKSADDAYIWADDEGESVRLVADGNGDWISLYVTGTWTVV